MTVPPGLPSPLHLKKKGAGGGHAINAGPGSNPGHYVSSFDLRGEISRKPGFMQVSVAESKLQRGFLPREGESHQWELGGWRDGVGINFKEAPPLRRSDNMGQQLHRHLDPAATSVSPENNS